MVEVGRPDQATCRAVRVDRQLDITGKLLVIKMDVEGHEMEAIEGLVGLLAKNRCIIQVELWSTPEEEMPRRLALLEALFARYDVKFVRAIVTDHFSRRSRARSGTESEQAGVAVAACHAAKPGFTSRSVQSRM